MPRSTILLVSVIVFLNTKITYGKLLIDEDPLQNNTLVFMDELGENENSSLTCTTSNTSCCSEHETNFGWFYPNGTRLGSMDEGHSLYLAAESGAFRLHYMREASDSPPGGIYRCTVPSNNSIVTYYAGIYPHGNGLLNGGEIEFELLSIDPVSYRLSCITSNGPPTNTFWRRNKRKISVSHSTSEIITDQVRATYDNHIVINENVPGTYNFHALNRNKDLCKGRDCFNDDAFVSPYSVQISGGMQTPQLVMVKETSPGWVRISWNNDNVAPNVTGFMILIADMNCISAITCREELQVARNESEKKVQLVMERTYQIKMVTLSRQLPSDPSAPIYHTVQKEKKPTMTTYDILGLVWFILSLLIIIILIIIVVMQYRKNRTESCENRTESWGKSEK